VGTTRGKKEAETRGAQWTKRTGKDEKGVRWKSRSRGHGKLYGILFVIFFAVTHPKKGIQRTVMPVHGQGRREGGKMEGTNLNEGRGCTPTTVGGR
jgi:hypothetical protein